MIFTPCSPNQACLDKPNFKTFIKNYNNTETYIEQLNNIVNELTEVPN